MDQNYYLTFTSGFPVKRAIEIFEKRYGRKPQTHFISGMYLKVGPEPKEQPDDPKRQEAGK